jgi:antitoxin YefM
MQQMTVEEFQKNITTVFFQVTDEHEPVVITLDQRKHAVILDMDDYESLLETFHLLSNPVNAERLREGMQQHVAGHRKVIDVTAYLD